MANRQPLSPAGYLINDDPLNTNPFFTFENEEIDPSTLERIRLLENDVATLQDENNTNKQNIQDNTEDISDLENEVISINNNIDELFQNYTNLLLSVNDLTDDLRTLEDAVDDIVIDYVTTSEFTQFQAETTDTIRDVDNKFVNYYNKSQIDYQFSTYSTQFGQQIQANTNAINSLTDLVGQANALLETI